MTNLIQTTSFTAVVKEDNVYEPEDFPVKEYVLVSVVPSVYVMVIFKRTQVETVAGS